MSVSYQAVIFVGLPFSEVFECESDFEDFDYGKHKSTEFEIVSPYYDASLKDCLVGFTIVETDSYSYKEIANTISTESNHALFKELTGKEAKVYLSVHST